jgi:hypothetical protein
MKQPRKSKVAVPKTEVLEQPHVKIAFSAKIRKKKQKKACAFKITVGQ